MSGFLQMLDKQKKRERQITVELNAKDHNTQWSALKKCEEEAQQLCQTVLGALPTNNALNPLSVNMQSYAKPASHSKLRIKTQVSILSNKQLQIKVHCHQVDPKGRFQKLNKVVYNYSRSRIAS